ncbi:MAG TPA: twin-arginine translocation signal domain-containing protein [Acidimicrobiales bacterium]|nr:twin-arginine translocation signal domain-containing protein [Acidimicrobiales bacterium]
MSPDRRTVLKGVGAGVVVVGGGLAGWRVLDDGGDEGGGGPTTTAPPAEPAATLSDALVALGGRYLADHPDEADRGVLLDALPALDGRVPERPGQALRVLADQAAADHGAGDVVEVDGWVLSRTECRAAALYAL